MKRKGNQHRLIYATGHVGQRVSFVCKAGHVHHKTYPERGPRGMSPEWIVRMAGPNGYWRKDRADGRQGHCYGACRACDKAEAE